MSRASRRKLEKAANKTGRGGPRTTKGELLQRLGGTVVNALNRRSFAIARFAPVQTILNELALGSYIADDLGRWWFEDRATTEQTKAQLKGQTTYSGHLRFDQHWASWLTYMLLIDDFLGAPHALKHSLRLLAQSVKRTEPSSRDAAGAMAEMELYLERYTHVSRDHLSALAFTAQIISDIETCEFYEVSQVLALFSEDQIARLMATGETREQTAARLIEMTKTMNRRLAGLPHTGRLTIKEPLKAAKTDGVKVKRGGVEAELTVDEVLALIPLPTLESPKLDGIRGFHEDGAALSRSRTPLPARLIQEWASKYAVELFGLDGEFIVGKPNEEGVYDRTQSFVMSDDKPLPEEGVTFYVFDDFNVEDTKEMRLLSAHRRVTLFNERHPDEPIKLVYLEHNLCHTLEDLLAADTANLEAGYEGSMAALPSGHYKEGYSTLKEAILVKVKRFAEAEGKVVGFEEAMTNTNEATISATGKTKRSKAKAGMKPAGYVGAFLVEYQGQVLRVGPGEFKKPKLKEIFENQASYIGRQLTFKHFPYGAKSKLRMPLAKSIRLD